MRLQRFPARVFAAQRTFRAAFFFAGFRAALRAVLRLAGFRATFRLAFFLGIKHLLGFTIPDRPDASICQGLNSPLSQSLLHAPSPQ
jgi:hypothetical protein